MQPSLNLSLVDYMQRLVNVNVVISYVTLCVVPTTV